MEGEDVIKGFLDNDKLRQFTAEDLRSSLSSIGHSDQVLRELLTDIRSVDMKTFSERNSDELHRIHTIGFFEIYAREYQNKYVVPEIPIGGKVLDLGCGTGVLARLIKERGQNEVIGIDILPYPEWTEEKSKGVRFEVVQEVDFPSFIKQEVPDTVVLTWVLHHMEFAEQERYLRVLYDALKPGAFFVALEDSYAESMSPEVGQERYEKFMAWSPEDRQKIAGIYDWVANRVMEQRDKVPMPMAYRTVEGWADLFKSCGFELVRARFIGFPEKRDVNTPQSLMVFKKV